MGTVGRKRKGKVLFERVKGKQPIKKKQDFGNGICFSKGEGSWYFFSMVTIQ